VAEAVRVLQAQAALRRINNRLALCRGEERDGYKWFLMGCRADVAKDEESER
jgi:hypothetical protein